MQNLDQIYQMMPWLKTLIDSRNGGGGAQTGGWQGLKDLLPNFGQGGSMFGGQGWPFFGNAGQSPGAPTTPLVHRPQFSGEDGGWGGSGGNWGGHFGDPGGGAAGGRPFDAGGMGGGGFGAAGAGGGPIRHLKDGGHVEAGEAAVVNEEGIEVFVADQPGTVIPNHAIPPWLQDALIQMPAPAAQPQQRGPLRSMAAGRQVADWRERDPDAAAQGTKDAWADIYADPGGTLENLGLTGQIIGAALKNASPNAAQAQPAGGKKARAAQATPMDKVMEEQQFLADKGFYRGTIDGAEGPQTIQARKEYQAAQDKLKEQQLKERELALQEQQLEIGGKRTEVQDKEAENEKTRLAQAETKRLADKERKDKGEVALRESEKNLSWYDKMLRSYGPTIGGLLGAGAGVASRAGIKKLGDMYQTSQAAKAEKTFEGVGGAVTKENLAERVGKTNDWWRRGGASNEPFVATPKTKPGVKVNPNEATAIKELYEPSRLTTTGADLAGMSLFGAKGAYAQAHLPDAQAAFEKAKKDVDMDASDVNIEAYQTAKSRLSALETLQKAAIGGGLSYPAYAMAKPRFSIKPSTNVAESEKLGIENFLRESRSAARKPAAEKGSVAAMRKFDNQGNPINRESPSLQELAEPRRAHVPGRTRKSPTAQYLTAEEARADADTAQHFKNIGGIRVNQAAFDDWEKNGPLSTNVEDRRGALMDIAELHRLANMPAKPEEFIKDYESMGRMANDFGVAGMYKEPKVYTLAEAKAAMKKKRK